MPPTPSNPAEELLASEDEDVAGKAMRFQVFSRKERASGGLPRLQHVVDKPVKWGPTVMPLSKVVQIAEEEAFKRKPVKRRDIKGVKDGFILQGVLSLPECERLVQAAEAQGFEYWAKETTKSSSMSGSSNNTTTTSVSDRVNHSYRSAHTLEVEHPELAEILWVSPRL